MRSVYSKGYAAVIAFALATGCSNNAALSHTTIALPKGAPGIGFDDLRFSPDLGKVLVPAGRSGNIDLVDPATDEVKAIGGFSAASKFEGGHDFGATSVDFGAGRLFVTDRTSKLLRVVDPAAGSILGSASLGAEPDYVRFVAASGEIWVTEPDSDQIEVFTLSADKATPAHAAFIKTKGGPESLVIDATRGRAYTHLWRGATLSIDVASRSIAATWPNGCKGSRGIDIDEARGFLFAGCSEGKAVVLDVANGGKQLSSLEEGSGVDIIAYSKALGHLYLPGGGSATMGILGVSAKGELSLLGRTGTASGAHCVTIDVSGNAYICDPGRGQLLKFRDTYPATK